MCLINSYDVPQRLYPCCVCLFHTIFIKDYMLVVFVSFKQYSPKATCLSCLHNSCDAHKSLDNSCDVHQRVNPCLVWLIYTIFIKVYFLDEFD